jgi:hypothetical protein
MTFLHSWDALSLEGTERKSEGEGKRNRKREQEEVCWRLSTLPLWAAVFKVSLLPSSSREVGTDSWQLESQVDG